MHGGLLIKNKRIHPPHPDDIYVGRPSILGNPYTHIVGKLTLADAVVTNREEAIAAYLPWLREQYSKKGEVYQELNRLTDLYQAGKDINLVCWCAPQDCHARIIIEAIMGIANDRENSDG